MRSKSEIGGDGDRVANTIIHEQRRATLIGTDFRSIPVHAENRAGT